MPGNVPNTRLDFGLPLPPNLMSCVTYLSGHLATRPFAIIFVNDDNDNDNNDRHNLSNLDSHTVCDSPTS